MRYIDKHSIPGYTFNPWWGCTKISDGCTFCYAEDLSRQYGYDVWGPGRERRQMSGRYWDAPLRWNASAERAGLRARVFCATMADLFESNAPAGQLDRLWSLIARTAHLDWQLLTKRPERILTSLPTDWDTGYRNVWLGTTVEDHRVAGRIEIIRDIPAVVRFLSLEPLIGPISNLDLRGIHWVIVGGESGPNARPIRREWVSEILAQCSEQNVAFFFHQWGGVNKGRSGRLLNGRVYEEMPQTPFDSDAHPLVQLSLPM